MICEMTGITKPTRSVAPSLKDYSTVVYFRLKFSLRYLDVEELRTTSQKNNKQSYEDFYSSPTSYN